MPEKLLIIGKGFLGNAIYTIANNFQIKTIATNYSNKDNHLDITNIDLLEKKICENNPDVIINCAALTNIDQIESDPKMAYSVNAYGAKNVALVSAKNKINLVHISTDGVFDGHKGLYREEDLANPINEYARSKKMGEDFVREILDKFIIIRTNFYGHNKEDRFLFNWILRNLQNHQIITGFHDIIFNPLEVNNLATMIIELINTNFSGIIHLSSDEVMNKYEFAVKIANVMNFNTSLIKKGSVKDSNFVAKRPLNTSLSNLKAKSVLKTKPITLENWLKNLSNY